MLRRLAKTALEFYATRLPYHRGKWRVIEGALRAGQIEGLDRDQTFEVDREGVRWSLRTDCVVQRRLYYHGGFDRHDVRELLAHVPAGGIFFDIGSYFGYYALLAAQRGARVFAFEPVPANYDLLAKHAALNPWAKVQTFPLALSDRVGKMRFALPSAENRGRGHLLPDDLAEQGDEVRITTLDAFAMEHGIERLDALKLDVEGAECRVLAGATETIARCRPAMLIELNPPCLERFASSETALLKAVRELGYEIWVSRPYGLVRFDGRREDEDYVNIICLPLK